MHKRSELPQSQANVSNGDVIILDTIGELKAVYSLATVAIVGGSFSEKVQGHNPIEPAALGIPTIFGPHMKNFSHVASILTESGGVIQVEGIDSLAPALEKLLGDAALRERMGALAQAAVQENQGALTKTIEHMRDVIK